MNFEIPNSGFRFIPSIDYNHTRQIAIHTHKLSLTLLSCHRSLSLPSLIAIDSPLIITLITPSIIPSIIGTCDYHFSSQMRCLSLPVLNCGCHLPWLRFLFRFLFPPFRLLFQFLRILRFAENH